MLARTANSSALRASLAAATPSSSLVAAAAPRFISSSTPRSANPEQSTDTIPTQRLRPRAAPLSPSAPPPSGKPYSHLTVSIVKGVAKLMGYNSRTSTAIRVTSDLYDRCAERAEAEADFWYGECGLPRTYQTWFQLTNLHIYLMLVRFRALPAEAGPVYAQELINHFFIDAESRMRERFGVQTGRLVKGYMRDMHMQHRGAVLGLDEGLASNDVRLAQALWRNVWGAGWGNVAGVKRKVRGIDKSVKGEDELHEGAPELAQDRGALPAGASPYARAAAAEATIASGAEPSSPSAPTATPTDPQAATHPELAFPIHLARVVRFIRAETFRLANIPDQEIVLGRQASAVPSSAPANAATSAPDATSSEPPAAAHGPQPGAGAEDAAAAAPSIVAFGRI